MNSEQSGTEVLVGKVSKPHGIKGQLKIFPYSGSIENFKSYSRVLLSFADQQPSCWFDVVHASVSQGKFAVLSLKGVRSRSEAEALAGAEVWVDQDELPPLADNEFYWQDLIGKDVITVDGVRLGKVTNLLATGAHDVLVVAEKGREYMIPAVDQFVLELNEDDVLVVDPPEGLLEINI